VGLGGRKRTGRSHGTRFLLPVTLLLAFLYSGTIAALSFKDPEDGKFDVSEFLDKPYGFIPVISPITQPAVGYGAAAALVFVKRVKSEPGQPPIRPNIGAVGGAWTENGSKGYFGGVSNTWMNGKLRTVLGVGKGDVNLEFYGLEPGSRPGDDGIDYTINAKGGLAGVSYQLGESGWWVGARYLRGSADASLRFNSAEAINGLPDGDYELDLAAITPRLTLDTRNNTFTPTSGSFIDLTVPLYRETWGSDRDFTKGALTGMWFHPLNAAWYFGVRGTANTSSGGTPFYLQPGITLRGVEAIRYQGDDTAEMEAELRWQFNPRWSLVGFAGTGIARAERLDRKRSTTVVSGGGGFRYLVARRYGIHMGLDVGFGPDQAILYVVFGSAWNRE